MLKLIALITLSIFATYMESIMPANRTKGKYKRITISNQITA